MAIPAHLRVPNHILRAIRLGLYMSQSEFAAAVRRAGASLDEPNTCNKRLIQKWESGEHTSCRPNYKRALQAVTRTPFEQLGFADALVVPVQVAAEQTGQVTRHVAGPQIAPPDPSAGSAERLRFALTPPGRADQQSVEMTTAMMQRLFLSEQHLPARSLIGPVNRQVEEISPLLAGTGNAPLRRRLAGIGGALCALAGWLALETGDPAAAHRYLDSALASARYAADSPLAAATLIYLSYAAAERGDPATGWQLAHTGNGCAGEQPRVKAWAAARAAQSAAHLGEHDAALRELSLALALAPDLGPAAPEDGTPPWALFVDTAYLYAIAADVHGQLAKHEHALEYAHLAVDAASNGRTKTRALILAQAACSGASANCLDLVEQCAYEAADLADKLESTQAWRKLRLLRTLIKPYRSTVLTASLTDRLSTLPK